MSLFRRRAREEARPEPLLEPRPGSCDPEEIRRAEKAFLTYTDYRRKQLESQVGRTSTQALRVLPLLLHFNQPGVPGYVDDPRCPTGIGNYQPTDADLQLARVFFRTPLRRTGIFRPFVELVEELTGGELGNPETAIHWDRQTFHPDRCPDPYAEAARGVRAHRRNGLPYGIHLTRLILGADTDERAGGTGFLSTGHYLSRKRIHEARLNTAGG